VRNPRHNHFFIQGSISEVTRHQEGMVRQDAAKLAGDEFGKLSVDELATALARRHSIDVPELDEASITSTPPRDVQIDVSQDPFRHIRDRSRPFNMAGTEIKISVPFQGDAALFAVRPMSFTTSFPMGDVVGSAVVFTKAGIDLKSDETLREFNGWLAEIKQYLGWHREALVGFNDRLLGVARTEIEQRKAKLDRDKDLGAGLGFPIKG